MRSSGMYGYTTAYQPQSQESLRLILITAVGKLFRLGYIRLMHSVDNLLESLARRNSKTCLGYGV